MDTNNWRPAQGGAEPTMETGDWRTQLQHDYRQRIVNKIMDTLKRHLPYSGQEGLQERKKIAVRFEEKIYIAATSQADYLRKISLKMLTMEPNSQNTTSNYLPSNSATSENPTDYTGKGVDFLVLLFLGCSMIFGARKSCYAQKVDSSKGQPTKKAHAFYSIL